VTRQPDGDHTVLPALLAYREAAPGAFTPPPVAALEAVGRRRRRRRAASATAAAVIVLLVGVGAAVAILSRTGETSPGAQGLELRYSPTWLPPGLKEVSRRTSQDGTFTRLVRTWTREDIGGNVLGRLDRLQLSLGPDAGAADWKPVDINGRPGHYAGKPMGPPSEEVEFSIGRPTGVTVRWMPDDQTMLTLTDAQLRLSLEDMLRIARSVRPDPARLTMPFHVGWVPKDMYLAYSETVGDSPASWRSELTYYERLPDPDTGEDKLNSLALQFWIGPTAPARAGGSAITVAGRPARFIVERRVTYPRDVAHVVLDPGLGVPVTVTGLGPWDHADLLRVAEHLRAGPPPDLSWLGRR
jgi:hypothetical protein